MSEIKEFFDKCKEGEYGVMPYHGERVITFVWTNKKGYGRIAKLTLNKKGIEEAIKFDKEIEELNKK